MKQKLFFLLVVSCLFLSASAQKSVKSGLLLNGGIGSIKSEIKLPLAENIKFTDVDYNKNLSVGYRLRFMDSLSSPRFFIDWDSYLGIRFWNSAYRRSFQEPPAYEASSHYYYVSTAGTINCKLIKGLSLGIGFEPTYSLYQVGESSKNKFDIPAIGKIAYDFGAFELGVSYKHGLMNTIKTDRISSGRFHDWQVSLFIPLRK